MTRIRRIVNVIKAESLRKLLYERNSKSINFQINFGIQNQVPAQLKQETMRKQDVLHTIGFRALFSLKGFTIFVFQMSYMCASSIMIVLWKKS